MPLISWTADLLTGNEFIDDDHRDWIDKINAVLDAITQNQSEEQVRQVLSDLVTYTVRHFEREESELQFRKCDMTGEHRAEHIQFLKRIVAMMDTLEAGKSINLKEEHAYFSTWLRNHFLNVDMKLAKVLRSCV